jgi:rare lipoprotein A (peptidoglycan hydrolase)
VRGRALVLTGVALLATVGAFAIASRTRESSATRLPQPAGSWYRALAAPYPEEKPTTGACGVVIDRYAMGVANPVLPCGVKLFIQYRGKQVLTQVIDRGPAEPGREFDLTRAVAKVLGLTGTKTIAWRFAR